MAFGLTLLNTGFGVLLEISIAAIRIREAIALSRIARIFFLYCVVTKIAVSGVWVSDVARSYGSGEGW